MQNRTDFGISLIKAVAVDGATQPWFADDSGAGGKRVKLRQWWDLLVEKGPSYGYYPNAEKPVLSVKLQFYADAIQIFDGTGVTINTNGCRYLGAAIASTDFTTAYTNGKIATWTQQVKRLGEIATSQPQAAYSAFARGLQSKLTFLC